MYYNVIPISYCLSFASGHFIRWIPSSLKTTMSLTGVVLLVILPFCLLLKTPWTNFSKVGRLCMNLLNFCQVGFLHDKEKMMESFCKSNCKNAIDLLIMHYLSIQRDVWNVIHVYTLVLLNKK